MAKGGVQVETETKIVGARLKTDLSSRSITGIIKAPLTASKSKGLYKTTLKRRKGTHIVKYNFILILSSSVKYLNLSSEDFYLAPYRCY